MTVPFPANKEERLTFIYFIITSFWKPQNQYLPQVQIWALNYEPGVSRKVHYSFEPRFSVNNITARMQWQILCGGEKYI